MKAQPRSAIATVPSNAATNLKTLLKTLIAGAVSNGASLQDDVDEDDEIHATTRKGSKLLNYDLRTLSDFVREQKIRQIAVVLPDTEAFDSDLLSETIDLLSCWRDRIPFVLIFGLATSIGFLEQRLSQTAIRCLKGSEFGVPSSAEVLQRVFRATVAPESQLWIGPELIADQLERQSDYVQDIEAFAAAGKYAYMAHYYANALSIFSTDTPFKKISAEHFEAVRMLASFQDHAKELLGQGDARLVRDLLDDDEALYKQIHNSINEGRILLAKLLETTKMILRIQRAVPGVTVSAEPALYVQTMSGKLQSSTLIRNLLLSIRKSTSEAAMDLLQAIIDPDYKTLKNLKATCLQLLAELLDLESTRDPSTAHPLRSAEDVHNNTLRTTIVSQKVELSKQKSTLSKQDAAYTAILRKLTDALSAHFDEHLVDPKTLPFNEIFIYDLEWPHRGVFTPRPRNAIERALANPHDYLACECCRPGSEEAGESVEGGSLSATQPATAVLYQLYLESGSLINVHDLWQAFQAVMGDDAADEEHIVALFQRGLAEMRYLGLMKSTRKKTGHVGKAAWKGL